MDKAKIVQLLALIGEVTSADTGPWKAKRDLILADASDDDKTNLAEFAGWFDDADAE